MKKRGAVFRQSLHDFPCLVELGKKPSWGIKRWDGCNGLRFVPADDEGFSLRGDGRRLLYKGRKKSHRITILGDTAFEYDCILEREPESNVVALRMEGAEQFDFFWQPDFVRDPFLKGSYAVYKKETLIGEGTGKLCHIHRPLIIDALGRKVWGDLAVIGNELRITIPEQWLARAKYPVVVDPVIGTETAGSLDSYINGIFYDDEEDEWFTDYISLRANDSLVLNKVIIPESMGESGTFYVYKRGDLYNSSIRRSYPCMYTNVNNKPHTKISRNEAEITDPLGYKIQGWLQADMQKNSAINNGDCIWFGFRGSQILLSFDYGGIFENVDVWSPYYYNGILIPEIINNDCIIRTTEYNRDIKVSMYFSYTGQSQHYISTITQGVALTDSRKGTAEYKRAVTQTVISSAVLSRFETFFRQCVINVSNNMAIGRLPIFSRSVVDGAVITEGFLNKRGLARKCNDTTTANDVTGRAQSLIRELGDDPVSAAGDSRHTAEYRRETHQSVEGTTAVNMAILFFRQCVMNVSSAINLSIVTDFFSAIFEQIGIVTGIANNRHLTRRCDEAVAVHSEAKREQGFFGVILDMVKASDTNRYSVMFLRTVSETQGITDTVRHLGNYIRCLYIEAGNIAETIRWGDYYRTESDTVQADGMALRHLFVFIRILTTSLVRDFILRRFLIAREELVLKSSLTRELFLDSKIN